METPGTRKHAEGAGRSSGDDWLHPRLEEEGLSLYLRTVRERLTIVIAIVAVALGAAVLYVSTASKVYEGEAELLLTPLPTNDEFLSTLGLPSQSADPLRDVQTLARLVSSNEVAERAREELRGVPEAAEGAESLLRHVSVEPVAESNLIAITTEAGDPDHAAEIANAFARAMIAERTGDLDERIDATLAQLRAGTAGEVDFSRAIAQLEALRAQGQDPTLQVATTARPASLPSWPRPFLTVAGALIAGLVLGLGAAFMQQALDPRLRREEQLRRMYQVPILARIPKEKRRSRTGPLAPTALSSPTAEAYRALRATLTLSRRSSTDGGRVVLVTGSSPSEGKSTTAINAAASLAAAGKRVILIEADLRRPAIGRALQVKPQNGVVSVMIESVPLQDALATTDTYERHLRLLLADYEGDWISDLFALPAARRTIEEARQIADYVIIDSPPLTDVVDALPLTNYVDDVLVVVRLGITRLAKLARLGDLLAQNGIKPIGFAVVGTKRPSRGEGHYYMSPDRRHLHGASREPLAEEGRSAVATQRASDG